MSCTPTITMGFDTFQLQIEPICAPDIELATDCAITLTVESSSVLTVGLPCAQGEPGPTGATGPAGPTGATGPTGPPASTYIHTQSVPAAVWTITHNLGQYPSVTVVDSAGSAVEGDGVYVSANVITITFTAAFAGVAYLN